MGGHGHGEVSIAKPMRADGIPRADDKIVQITFVDPNNVSMTVDAFCGETLLDCARRYQVGLRDLCSGRMPVASADYDAGLGCFECHVQVANEYVDRVNAQNKMSASEARNLTLSDEESGDITPNSRLSCQITITPDLDGMRVLFPQFASQDAV